jgi:hypothetical protein
MKKMYRITASKTTPFDSLEMSIRAIVENLWGCEAERMSEKTPESISATEKCYKNGFIVDINNLDHYELKTIPGVILTFLAAAQDNYLLREDASIKSEIDFHKERIRWLTEIMHNADNNKPFDVTDEVDNELPKDLAIELPPHSRPGWTTEAKL